MSHLDELDEFEAELELQLKREYTAVFSLFRYCVLTQDATYLCNKLDLKVVPQASYPFFHAQMEDVWVWDKNRPTRIIPRAEVYTSGDVTVEELRGEGDEPRLTAEALAERLGDARRADDDDVLSCREAGSAERNPPLIPASADILKARASPPHDADVTRRIRSAMLLAVDVGNTQTVLGLYDGERARPTTGASRPSARERATSSACCSAACSTRTPSTASASRRPCRRIVREWERLAERWAHAPLLVVGPGVKTGIPIRYDDPREVGPDRIVNAVAAKARYGAPAIVVDFGTSTNFDVVSPAGEYVGGVLAPGIEISMEALFARAARLVNVDFVAPASVIGKTTVARAAERARLRVRRSGRRDRRPHPRGARVAGGARDRDRRARGARRAAQRGDRARRPVPHPRRAPARLGAERVIPDAEAPRSSSRLASLALAVVPGPAVLYIVAQSVHGGRRAGVVSALGVSTGGMFHVAAAVIGLSAVLAASARRSPS